MRKDLKGYSTYLEEEEGRACEEMAYYKARIRELGEIKLASLRRHHIDDMRYYRFCARSYAIKSFLLGRAASSGYFDNDTEVYIRFDYRSRCLEVEQDDNCHVFYCHKDTPETVVEVPPSFYVGIGEIDSSDELESD